jgi:abortive infection bacteriophage resistance protein
VIVVQKIFKTVDEQVQILRDKGLVIDDEYETKETLLRENYFFISGYRHPFLKDPKSRQFKDGTNFRELYALFNFDRQLRNIIFKNLLIIENNMKSIFSYQLSKNYGFKENDYLKASNFNTSADRARQVNDLLRKIKRQIRINGGQHSATTHYIYNYGYVPLWVVVKVLSFGIVCELYSIMKREDQERIADIFNLKVDDLLSFLPILANYRNLCAHEDILYDHRTATMIDNNKYHSMLEIPMKDGEYTCGKNDLFALILILKFLLRDSEFRLMIKEIDYEKSALDGVLKSTNIEDIMQKMGFPKNYTKLLDI